jgi:hypothetical protein
MCGINDTKVETKFSDEVNDENIRLKVTSSSLPSSHAESEWITKLLKIEWFSLFVIKSVWLDFKN